MIYCFDLDDTLCHTEDGNYAESYPIISRIIEVNKLYDEGHQIIIETARGSETGINWVHMTKEQLDEWGLKYHQLRAGSKIYADVYVDDKAVHSDDFFNPF